MVLEILKPVKTFVIIEGKMFENLNQDKLDIQMMAQRTAVIDVLRKKYKLDHDDMFHVALVPALFLLSIPLSTKSFLGISL